MIFLTKNLAFLRKLKNASQEDVSSGTGIKRSTYSAHEIGTCEPNLTQLLTYSKYYKVRLDYLVYHDLTKALSHSLSGHQINNNDNISFS